MKKLVFLAVIGGFLSCDSPETKRDRFFLLGNEALYANEYNKAIDLYSKALQIDPEHIYSLNNRGVAKYENDYPYEALQDYNQALLIEPSYWECLENRVYVYEHIGRYESGIRDLDLLINQFPDSIKYLQEKGVLLTESSQHKLAKEIFIEALKKDPENADLKVNIATIEHHMGNNVKSLQTLKEVLQNQQIPNAYNTLNQVYLALDVYDSALFAINEAINLEPQNPYFLNNRGYTLLMMDSLDNGLENINKSILLDPENMWAFRNKGIYYLMNDEVELAIPYLMKASESSQKVENSFYYLGQAYQKQGKNTQACEAWKKGSQRNEPGSTRALSQNCS